MTIDEAINNFTEAAKNHREEQQYWLNERDETSPLYEADRFSLADDSRESAEYYEQLAEWLKELKEAKRLVVQLKAKLCDSSEYCAYCDELDMSERDRFTCKYKKKKIPAVCNWQVLTPAHFDDIPWAKNEALKLIGEENGQE